MENKKPKRNKKWDFEEMVAMVDIYMRHKDGTNTRTLEDDLKELSIALNKRADMLGIQKGDKFRNYSGVKKIHDNIKSIDTEGEKGLSHGSKLMHDVLKFYEEYRSAFDIILKHFNDNYSNYLVCITFLSTLFMHKLNR
jgi:hypothetical protein